MWRRFEPLEPRCLLSGAPLISEFLASNKDGLQDAEGDRHDWIEIYNPADQAANLTGWKLQDGGNTWTFPAVSLGPHESRIIFASGLNRVDPAAELHTNFKLAQDGEYLGLLNAAGTVVHEYAPKYPPQEDDISYGVGQQVQETMLVASGATAGYHVPADGSLGLSWTQAGFDDTAWAQGTTGLGFAAPVPGFAVANYTANTSIPNLATALSILATPSLQTSVAQETAPVYNYLSTGSSAHFANDRTYPGLTMYVDTDWFVTHATATLHVPAAGTWTFGVNSDDGFRLTIGAQSMEYPNPRGPGDTLAAFTFAAAGQYDLTLVVYENGGGSESELFAAPGSFTAWSQTTAWALVGDTANGGLAVTSLPLAGSGSVFASLVGTDVQAAMTAAGHASLYTRTAFAVADPASLDALTLQMKYDDGYVAWLNGVEIARRNAPSTLAYNATATAARNDIQATAFENVDVSAHLGLLTAEGNVLAIQALNVAAGDQDFLVLPELKQIVSQNAGTYYFATPTPGAFNSQDHWYPVADTQFSVDHGIYSQPFWLSLSTATPGATIRYTLNGSEPSDTGRVKSVAMLTRSGSTATAYSQSHGFAVGNSVRVSGADQLAYNGLFTITGVTADTFTYTLTGAPVSPATGVFRAVLDKQRSVTSLTRSGATATVTTSAAHGYATGDWVRIGGAEPTPYNGVFPITVLDANRFTYAVTGTPATPAEGAIVADLDNTKSVTSITRSGTTATVTLANHGYATHDLVRIAGAGQLEYNGVFAITVVDASHFTYTVPGMPTTPATGPITTQANCYTYSGPLAITKTSTVRAGAYKTGYAAANVDTQTYLFLADVVQQSPTGAAPAGWPSGPINSQVLDYGMDPDIVNSATWGTQVRSALAALPSLSIVTALPNLLNAQSGIYANAYQDGEQWERPASVELINPDGSDGFQVNAGLRIRGGYSRSSSNPKHAFRLLFKSQYGDAKLNYPLFGDEGVSSFDNVDLRCSQNYSWSFGGDGNNAEIREVFARDTQLAMGQVSSHSRFYHLYINGQYWGLYQSQERTEASFAASYFGGVEEDYDTIKVSDGYNIVASDGDLTAWQTLWNMAQAGFATDAAYYQAQGLDPVTHARDPAYPVYVDVDNLIDYMIGTLYGGDMDAPISNFLSNNSPNNWYGTRNRDGNSGFQFYRHDGEHTLSRANAIAGGEANRNGPWPAGYSNFLKSSPQYIHQELMAHPDYCLRFADRAQQYLTHGGLLTSQVAIDRFLARAEELGYSDAHGGAMVAESARWGDAQRGTPLTKTEWLAAVNNEINNFFPTRAGILLNQLKNTVLPSWRGGTAAPLYPNVTAPEFNQHGGVIPPGFQLTMTGQGTVYYTLDGTDPRLPGGAVRTGVASYSGPVTLNTSTRVLARSYDNGTWSALTDVLFSVDLSSAIRISELMYHPATATEAEVAAGYSAADFEFIELKNVGTASVPVGGLQFTNGVAFTFPTYRPNTSALFTLDPGQYVVVVANEAAFRARYPDFSGLLAAQYTGRLNDAGETIAMDGPDGTVIQEFSYGDGWYDITDGDGFSLTVRDARQELTRWETAAGWRASSLPGGTPGYDDTLATPGAVVINEVLAHSDTAYGDAVELYNTTAQAVDVSGWFLSDDAADLTKYQIAAGTSIPAGGYLVLTQGDNFGVGSGDPGARVGFGLSEYGDDVYLSSGATVGDDPVAGGYREHVDFGNTPNGISVGRHTKTTGNVDFTLLATPTFGTRQGNTFPGAGNSGPYQSPLVLNEIMYHPADPTAAEAAAGYRPGDFEYLEIYNRSGLTQTLNRFTLTGGIGFTFGWVPGDLLAGQTQAVLTQEVGATATWNATGLGSNNTYQVFATYKLDDPEGDERDLDDVAEYRIAHKNGTDTVVIDQDDTAAHTLDGSGMLWVDLGSYTFTSTGTVVLTRTEGGEQDDLTIADKLVFRRTGQSDKVFDNPTLNSPWMQTGLTTIAAGGYVVLTSNKAAFDARYHIAANGIPWAGTYSGRLADDGENINLFALATADADTVTGYIPAYKYEHVDYGDGPPNWPEEADGWGAALNRRQPDRYANDPANWQAGARPGTPGKPNVGLLDDTPPSVPAGLSATTGLSPNTITLNWTAATDPDSGVDHYAIYRDGLPVGTATAASFADTNVAATLSYSYQVSAVNRDGFESARSAAKTIGIPCIVSYQVPDATHIRLVFSEALTAASAQTLGNYTLNPGSLTGAVLNALGTTVTLTTSAALGSGTAYTVTVNNLLTVAGNPVPAGLQIGFTYVALQTGMILREYWTGITDNAVSDLTSDANYPDAPSGRNHPTSFEGPVNWTDAYGTRFRGYVHPPTTGSYTFWIASDDSSELWLSTSADPANKVKIAYVSGWTGSREWTKEANQQSAAITLTAGQKYYIEALQKEGGGGDNVAVRWQLPGGVWENGDSTAPIPGNRLSPYGGFPEFSPLTVTIGAVTPDPRIAATSTVTIAFSKPVTGFDRNDLTLTCDGGSNLLTTSQTLTTSDNITWTLGNLSGLTGSAGSYLLTLTALGSRILDWAGQSLSANATESWLMDPTPPSATIGAVAPDPRGGAVSQVAIVFTEPVTGFDRNDLTLNRNSGSNLLTAAQTLTSSDNVTWVLGNLSGLTGTLGSYTLSLTASGSGVFDATGNALAANATETWAVQADSTAPTATITAVAPDPHNAPVTELTIVFSEPVLGFDVGDLNLARYAPSGGNLLSGLQTLSTTDGVTWTLGNLAGITGDVGSYTLTLAGPASGITDLAGNALAAGASRSWTCDPTPPTATVIAVTPDPRDWAVATMTIVFSEPVGGVDLADFSLKRDGGANLLTGAQTLATADNITWTLGHLGGLTASGGKYILALAAAGAGISDAAGNALLGNATDVWTAAPDVAPPTVTITPVAPDPRNTAVGELAIVFSEPVSGFDLADLRLQRDGGANLLTAAQTLTAGDNISWTLGNLASLTAAPGSYTLTLTAAGSGITDYAGHALAAGGTESWVLDTALPTATITPIVPDPRNTAVGVVAVNFSEPVTGVDRADFALTRDGTAVSLSGAPFTAVSGAQYTLDLTTVTGLAGQYVLTLTAAGSNIRDAAGNAFAASASDAWTTDLTAPAVDIVEVNPDPRNAAVTLVTVNFTEAVTGVDLADFGLTRDGAAVSLSGLAVTAVSGTQYTLDLMTVTGLAGQYVLTLTAAGSNIQDAAGNALAAGASDTWTTELTVPTVDIVDVNPDPRNTAVGFVTVNSSEPVTGVDIADFGLTRDGTAVSLSGLTVTAVTGAQYTLDLTSVTGLAGQYVLTLTAAGSNIRDAAGNALTANASDTWTTDVTAPSADFVDVSPDPRNTAVSVVTVYFTEPVTGVDIPDFGLTRDGAAVSLSGLAVTAVSGTQYTLDLTTVTGPAGLYVLTLAAAGSNIRDAAGNALAANASDTWTIDVTAPSADFADVSPDPRNTAVGVVTVNFSKSVTGVALADFGLTRDGAAVNLSGLAVTAVSGAQYTLDLTSVTGAAGQYVLTLTAAGSNIRDTAGNALAANASDTWTTDVTAPSADLVDVSPDPRNTAVGVVTVNFTEPVTGVDLGDFSLTRDGAAVSLSGLTVSAVSGSQYTLDLTTATGLAGQYVLTLAAAGANIRDAAGNPLASNASEAWTTDLTAPTADVVDVSPDPRNAAVGVVAVKFSEPVTGVDLADFRLTRDGAAVSLSGLAVTAVSGAQYTLDLTAVTGLAGQYVLTLTAAGSDIRDAAGNLLASSVSDVWTIDLTAPTVGIAAVSPDPRNTAVGVVTVNFAEPVTGVDLGDFGLTRDGTPVSLSGLPVASVSAAQYTLDLTTITGPAGRYVLTLTAAGSDIRDAAGNLLASGASDAWTTDLTAPTVEIVAVTPDPRNTAVSIVTVNFDEPVTGVDLADFGLTRDGAAVSLNGLTVTAVSGAQYTLDLASVTGPAGQYVLTLTPAGSGIRDAAGNALVSGDSDPWTTDLTPPAADIVDVSPDPRTTAVGVVTVNFTEPVTGVDLADFGLTRDGAAVSLSGVTVTALSATQYTLNLTSVTGLAGQYVLTLAAAGSHIRDAAGNLLGGHASDTWTLDLTAPVADILDLAPDPRNAAVGLVMVNFTEPVTGVDSTDFRLTRDGTAVSLSGVTVTAVSGAQYTLDLTSVTGPAGQYVLTLTAAGASIRDVAGNALIANATDTWTTDRTAPEADILDVNPDPRHTVVGIVTVRFTEDVTGVAIGDFGLTRDGAAVSLDGVTLTAVSGTRYTLDLTSVTGPAGQYVLTLTAAAQIADLAGNALAVGASETWTTDLTAPGVDIVDVAPDPRIAAVGVVTVDFTEPVTGVDIADFALTRDGAAVSLSGVALTAVNEFQYTLDLTGVTGAAGQYVLTLTAAGASIEDLAGNPLTANASDLWTNDPTVLLAEFGAVSPELRNTAVAEVTVNFTAPVTGVDLADFRLTRDAAAVSLSGATLSAVTASQYTLDLTNVTGLAGRYVLTLSAAGSEIRTAAGSPLVGDASTGWTTELTPPAADVVDVSPDPRNTAVSAVIVNFTEAVSGVDRTDFRLTRDGAVVSLSGLTVTALSSSQYTLDLTHVTNAAGHYVLTLTAAGSNIRDTAGNGLATDAGAAWTTDLTAPGADIVDVSPDPRHTAVGLVTVHFTEAVTGVDLADFRLTRDGAAVSLSGLAVTAVSGLQYTLDLTSVTGVGGQYALTLTAAGAGIQDAAGNALASDAGDSFVVSVHPWQNARRPEDVNDDTFVTALDVLLVITYLNTYGSDPLPVPAPGSGGPPPYVDVNADDYPTPLDALLVITYINNESAGEAGGAGESPAVLSGPVSRSYRPVGPTDVAPAAMGRGPTPLSLPPAALRIAWGTEPAPRLEQVPPRSHPDAVRGGLRAGLDSAEFETLLELPAAAGARDDAEAWESGWFADSDAPWAAAVDRVFGEEIHRD